MTLVPLVALGRAVRSAAAALALAALSGLGPVSAQETPAETPAAEAAAAGDAAVETVPVDGAEPEAALPVGVPERPYNFLAARFRHTELDDSAEDGFGIEASYLLGPSIYALAAVLLAEGDDARGTESTQFELGGGYRLALSPAMDLNAAIRVVQRDIDSEPQSEVKMGFQADAGVRASLWPRLEGSLGARYAETSRTGRAFLTGAALFDLAGNLSIGAEAVVGSSSTTYGLVGRWAF